MSVLNTLKGKIVHVQQDISESLLSLTKAKPRRKSNADTELTTFSIGASHELLSQYQSTWAELHRGSEDLARRAQHVDGQITNVFQYLDQQDSALSQFAAEMSSLVQLVVDVSIAKDKIVNLEGAFRELESSLVELEDACNQKKHMKMKQEQEDELRKYRQGKTNELEQVKAGLAKVHAVKVQKYEEQLGAALRERQKVFEEVHREEMMKYMKTGQVEYLPKSPVHTSDLADIELELNQNELDQFLSTVDDIEPQGERTMLDSETDDEPENQGIRILTDEDCSTHNINHRYKMSQDGRVLNVPSDTLKSI